MTNPANAQPTLGLNQLVITEGIYPSQDGVPGDDPGYIYLASIRTFAGNFAPDGSLSANGQLLPIAQNTALFSLLGTNYGGNGQTNFALPDLRGRLMVGEGADTSLAEQFGSESIAISRDNMPTAVGGSGQALGNDQPSLGVQYLIYVGGDPAPAQTGVEVGQIVSFLGNFVPKGYLLADGSTLSAASPGYQELFSVIGTTFGSNGAATFKLPDLRDKAIVGTSAGVAVGTVLGSDNTSITGSNLQEILNSPIDNHQPSVAMNFLIAVEGIYPAGVPENEQFLGEIIAYAGPVDAAHIPPGWEVADGRVLSIAQNTALFSLLGTTYGGNGQTTFALPDLRGRSMTEFGTGPGLSPVGLGEKYGTGSINLITSDLPPDILPQLTLPADDYQYAAGQSLSLIGTGISVGDADAGTGLAQLTITASDGVLHVAAAASVSVSGDGTNSVTLTGTIAQLNSFLSSQGQLAYSDLTPTPSGVTLTFQLNDGGNTGSGSSPTTGTATIDVVNGPPTVGDVTLPSIQVNSGAHLITSALLLANASDLDSSTLTVTDLHIDNGFGAFVNNGDGTWTYTPKINDDTQVDFAFTVSDGEASSSGQAKLDITPAQSTPEIGGPGDDTFAAVTGNAVYNGLGGIDTITFDFKLTDATVTYAGNQVSIDGPLNHTVLTGFEKFVFTDGTVDNADGNWLVEDLFYFSRNHDVWNAHLDADAHYNSSGWHQNLDPNAFFSTSTYLSANPDVKAAGVHPLDHWHAYGWTEGRVPSVNFDPRQYLDANPDVAAAHIDPLAHFLQFGASEGRNAFAADALVAANGFDYVYYLANNADVAAAGVNPLQHFQMFGWQEGRNPNALFDVNGYIAHYGDVDAANVNPLDHYNTFGWREGRDPSIDFDTTAYLAANADVAAAGVNPLLHFLHFGIHEGRSAFADGIWG